MMKKKVLFLTQTFGTGGAEKVLVDIVKNLDQSQFDVTVMKINHGNFYQAELEQYANCQSFLPELTGKLANVTNFIMNRCIQFLPTKWLARIFIRQAYDIEIAFLEGASVKIIAHSPNQNAKKLTWIHTDLQAEHITKNLYKSLAEEIQTYQKFEHCLCVSDAAKQAFEVKMENSKATTLYNPVDEKAVISKANEVITTWKKTKLTVVSVGRLHEHKGYDRLLEAHRQLVADGFDYELVILGEGAQRAKLEQFIVEHNLESSVKLLGFQANPYPYIKQADIFVCASRLEGYSLVVAEALILGKPVVSTKCSGPNELLQFGESGVVVENSWNGLYLGLKKVLEDEKQREFYAKKASERGSDFKIKNTIKKIERYFNE
ncbi:MAG: glycosyltransferase [Culicoidibacterales bacterium]